MKLAFCVTQNNWIPCTRGPLAEVETMTSAGTALLINEANRKKTPSPRQTTILQLLAEGYNYRQIAVQLETSYQVVKNYLRPIRDNLGANSMIHAVVLAKERGYIR